jgi:cell division FtsZ-interacting protein ZapD
LAIAQPTKGEVMHPQKEQTVEDIVSDFTELLIADTSPESALVAAAKMISDLAKIISVQEQRIKMLNDQCGIYQSQIEILKENLRISTRPLLSEQDFQMPW